VGKKKRKEKKKRTDESVTLVPARPETSPCINGHSFKKGIFTRDFLKVSAGMKTLLFEKLKMPMSYPQKRDFF